MGEPLEGMNLFVLYHREIAARNPHGLESDVWSLGCMLYTFLVGHPPFDVSGSCCSIQ